MNPDHFRAWYAWHKWSSLVCTLFMLLLCVTGLPLIFAHEIDHLMGYSMDPPETVSAPAQTPSVESIVNAANARRPGDAVQFLVADPEEPDIWFVRLGAAADGPISAFYTYDARTGDFVSEYPLNQGFMNVMYRLHVDMFAGLPGTLFLGFMGLLLVVSLVSGAVVYAPYMRKLKFGTIRKRRRSRIKWLDVHNLIGIVTLAWLLVVGITGVVNTLAIPIFGHWQNTALAAMLASHEDGTSRQNRIPVDQALAAMRRAEPDKDLSFLAYPGNEFAGAHHYVAYMQGDTPLTSKLLEPVLINASTGEATASAPLPWSVSVLLLSQPLHFGDYGGLPLKILWAILDVLAIAVLITGLYLWWKKRKTAPAPPPARHAAANQRTQST